MKGSHIILLVLLVAAGIAAYLWSFTEAKIQADDILQQFKKAEQGIASSADSLNRSISTAKTKFPVALLRSQIILLIDSLKEEYGLLPANATAMNITRKKYPDIKRLLLMIQQMNTLQLEGAGAGAGAVKTDTISYWIETKAYTEKSWMRNYFEQAKTDKIITCLDHLKAGTLQME